MEIIRAENLVMGTSVRNRENGYPRARVWCLA